jgi:hypothetical protein
MRARWIAVGLGALGVCVCGMACGGDKVGAAKDAGHKPSRASEGDAAQTHTPGDHTRAVSGKDAGSDGPTMTFFVSSDKSMTGDLGGLKGADARCQNLAQAAGAGAKTWHAYLSVEHDSAHGDGPVHARDRIGHGPWYNSKGARLAESLDALHALKGDAELFLDEHGHKVPGQWPGSPPPLEHDVLTGSASDGMVLAGETCADWTSASASQSAQVGHTDGLGPNQNPNPPYASWNSSHANGGCNDTAPRGGAGRIYCFAAE